MHLICTRSRLSGAVDIPGSKSHTIRAVAVSALADGESRIDEPLASADTLAAVEAYQALGAEVRIEPHAWHVRGTAGRLKAPANIINVKNSGTTLRLALGSAASLAEGLAVFTGDHQIRRRPLGPLAALLNDLVRRSPARWATAVPRWSSAAGCGAGGPASTR